MTSNRMPFWAHVEELRSRLFKCLLALFFGSIITHKFSDDLLLYLIEPTNLVNVPLNFQVLEVTSMFMIKIGLALMGGIVISIPIIIYQIWSFVIPAFNQTYGNSILFNILFSTIFFILGLTFGYQILIPFSLDFFTSIVSETIKISYNFTLNGYLIYVMWLLFACGLIFQLPVVIAMGTKVGIVTPPFLKHYRKYFIVIFLILSALLTPPDPLSQFFIFIPLSLLYEFSILLSWIFVRKQ